jgi:hypothetical protein
MKLPHYIALLVFAPALVFAQPPSVDPNTGVQTMDTVFFMNVSSALSDYQVQLGIMAATANGGYTSKAFTDAHIAAQTDIQNYQDNINGVIDANSMAHAPQEEYRHMVALGEVAAKTKDVGERKRLFGNFLFDTRGYLHDHPDTPRLWVMRGAAALQLDRQATGVEAAKFLLAMPPEQRTDPRIQKLVEIMEKKGWLPSSIAASASAATVQPASAQIQK